VKQSIFSEFPIGDSRNIVVHGILRRFRTQNDVNNRNRTKLTHSLTQRAQIEELKIISINIAVRVWGKSDYGKEIQTSYECAQAF